MHQDCICSWKLRRWQSLFQQSSNRSINFRVWHSNEHYWKKCGNKEGIKREGKEAIEKEDMHLYNDSQYVHEGISVQKEGLYGHNLMESVPMMVSNCHRRPSSESTSAASKITVLLQLSTIICFPLPRQWKLRPLIKNTLHLHKYILLKDLLCSESKATKISCTKLLY